ncbi:hypothetical protein C8J57DRAFT_1278403 [Mycena rebaudengoi]|nr:hypothetical protein C8J57DRAFT_1278403 [Mycena rebaudengoi]
MNGGDADEDSRALRGRAVGTNWNRTWHHAYATVSTGCWFIFGVRIRPRIIPNGVVAFWALVLAIYNAIELIIRALSTILVRNLAVNTGRRITSGVRISQRIIANGLLVVCALVLALYNMI